MKLMMMVVNFDTAKIKKDKIYQEKPTFIKADRILELTKKVCDVLIEPI